MGHTSIQGIKTDFGPAPNVGANLWQIRQITARGYDIAINSVTLRLLSRLSIWPLPCPFVIKPDC